MHPHIPKAASENNEEDDDDVPLHGAINDEEAKLVQPKSLIPWLITKLGTDVQDDVQHAMKQVIH